MACLYMQPPCRHGTVPTASVQPPGCVSALSAGGTARILLVAVRGQRRDGPATPKRADVQVRRLACVGAPGMLCVLTVPPPAQGEQSLASHPEHAMLHVPASR